MCNCRHEACGGASFHILNIVSLGWSWSHVGGRAWPESWSSHAKPSVVAKGSTEGTGGLAGSVPLYTARPRTSHLTHVLLCQHQKIVYCVLMVIFKHASHPSFYEMNCNSNMTKRRCGFMLGEGWGGIQLIPSLNVCEVITYVRLIFWRCISNLKCAAKEE